MSSIYQLEAALICRSNNKLSFDALYLYMVKTYDPAVAQICLHAMSTIDHIVVVGYHSIPI
jgi:hypothetical protein